MGQLTLREKKKSQREKAEMAWTRGGRRVVKLDKGCLTLEGKLSPE